MSTLIKSFFSEATAKGARSPALHPLLWTFGLLLSALALSVYIKAPEWLLIGLAICAAALTLVIVSAYVYLLKVDPDALRSEEFTLSKMAIEKGLIGDDIAGLRPGRIGTDDTLQIGSDRRIE